MNYLTTDILKNLLDGKTNLKIKLLGDSITHGVGGSGWEQNGEVIVDGWAQSPDSYCWATLFRDYMAKNYGARVVNKACTGTCIEFIINHFDALVDDDDDLIICTIGTNNRNQYDVTPESVRITPEELSERFFGNVKKLNEMIGEKGVPVIFMANIPASQSNEQDGENYWRIIHMCDINDIYKKAARECGIALISLYDLFMEYCDTNGIAVDSLLCDGLHPNDEGYKVMFDLLVKAFNI